MGTERGGGKFVRQTGERLTRILVRARQHVDVGVRRNWRGGFVRIGEERHRLAQPAQDDVACASERLHRGLHHIADVIDRHPSAAARDAGVGTLGDQPRAGGSGDASAHSPAPPRAASPPSTIVGEVLPGRDVGGLDDLSGVGARLRRHRERFGDRATLIHEVSDRGLRHGRGDLAWMRERGLHRHGGITATVASEVAVRTQAEAPRPALGLGGQRHGASFGR